jgi:glycosyltransferase involved in cell wall biosynthesis/outer membrane protein assembly factor BamB
MKIGIDGNSLTRPFQNGTRRYSDELLKNIAKIDKNNQYIIFANTKVSIPQQANFKLVVLPRSPILKHQLFLPIAASKENLDIFHNIDSYGSIFLKVPHIVTTVHDINLGTVYPTFRNLKYFSKRIYSEILRFFTFRNTDMFISVSKSTDHELKKYLKEHSLNKRSVVVYEATPNVFRKPTHLLAKKRYFLCMGDFSPRKNLEQIFAAFIHFQKHSQVSYELYVVVSTKEESINIKKTIHKYNLSHFVKVFVSPSDSTILNLYSHAMAFLYPSLYEGFGLPILEAMSAGCPVITSKYGATEEIAGGAAALVNPRSAKSICKAMHKIAKNKTNRNSLIENGYKRAKKFSWRETALKTINSYRNVYNVKKHMPIKFKADQKLPLVPILVLISVPFFILQLFSTIKNSYYAWSTFVTDGPIAGKIIKMGNALIFGTDDSKLFYLNNNSKNIKSFDLNTGNANWIGFYRDDVVVMSDDTIRSIRVKDQKLNWQVSTNDQKFFEKAEIHGNIILAGDADGSLSAYRISDGKLLWKFIVKPLTTMSSVIMSGNLKYFGDFNVYLNTIYLASQDENVYAINLKSGHLLWKTYIGDTITSFPDYYLGKYIYIGTKSGESINLDGKTGKIIWKSSDDSSVVCSVIMPFADADFPHTQILTYVKQTFLKIFHDDKIGFYELHADGTFLAKDSKSGNIIWKTKQFGSSSYCPSFWKSYVALATSNGNVVFFSLGSGKIIFEKSNLGQITNLPIIKPKFPNLIPDWLNIFSPDIFLENSEGKLLKINGFTGKEIWNFSVDAPSQNELNIIGNNIFFSTSDSVLYRINARTGLPDISLKEKKFDITQQVSKMSNADVLELTLKSNAVFMNPWVEANIYAVFTNESGTAVTMPGFYYDQNTWKIRFNAPTKGIWKWTVYWIPHGSTLTRSGEYTSLTDTSDYYLKVSKATERLTADGTNIFNGLGIGDAMNDYNYDGTLYDDWALGNSNPVIATNSAGITSVYRSDIINTLDDYIKTYGLNGAGFNIFRWSLMNGSPSLYTNLGSPTTYSILQGKIGDQLVQKLRENNLHIWLTMFGFDIPYKDSNNPADMYLLKSYVKYLYARYGAYVDVWELANELAVPYPVSDILTNEIKSLDYENRPVSISSSDYNLKYSDIVAPHWYETENISMSDSRTASQIKRYEGFNKPIVFAEQGNLLNNYDKTSAIRMRIRSWTSFIEGGILIFWNQSDSKNYQINMFPANIYLGEEERKYTSILQNLTSSFPLDSNTVEYTLKNFGIRGYGLSSDTKYMAYFYHYSSPFSPTKFTVTVSTRGGNFRWIDPATGNVLKNGTCPPGSCTLESPIFSTDVSLFISKDNQ